MVILKNVSTFILVIIFLGLDGSRLFVVSDSPTISFSFDQAATSTFQISPFANSFFEIFLSDTNLYEATLTCTISPANSPIQFLQNPISISIGSKQININYQLNFNQIQFSTTYTVTCSAQTVSGANQQYQATATALVSFKTPTIDLLSPSGQFRVYGSNLEIPLELNPSPQSTTKVTIQCGLARFDTLNALISYQNSISPNTCPSALTSPPKPSSLAGYSFGQNESDWYLIDPTNSSIELSLVNIPYQTDKQNVIKIERRPFTSIKSSFYAYLSLVCCDLASQTSQSTAYQSVTSRLIISVPVSKDSAAVLPQAPSNDDLLNPNYDPCTCDLTVSLCDIGCCCDNDCAQEDKDAFNFVCPIRRRTVFEKSIDRWSCYDIYNRPKLVEEDWFPILCIQFNFTYILGNFYSPNDLDDLIKNNYNQFLNLIQRVFAASYNYQSSLTTNDRNPLAATLPVCSLSTGSNYTYGRCLIQTDANGNVEDFLRFPLARNSLSSCIFDSPLRFLSSDSSIFCQILVNQNNCNAQTSQLNFNSFVNKIILANPSMPSQLLEINQVEYYQCPNFLASSIPVEPTNAALNKCNYNFAVNTRLFDNNADANACDGSTWGAPSSSDSTETRKITNNYYQSAFLASCNRLATPPAINSQAGSCSNVLAGVRYVFFWSGSSIQKVIARVIFTNAVYDPTTTTFPLKQLFQNEWVYNSVTFANVNSMQDYDTIVNGVDFYRQQKSGTTGYIMGRPIISGFKSAADTTVDISYNLRISSQRLLNGVLCGTLGLSERELVKFGSNVSSTCVVQVALANLVEETGCTNLKRILFQKLNSYYAPSNLVSKNGNPNLDTFTESDWISVLPSERSFLNASSSTQTSSFGINTCKGVPYQMNVWFFYESVGRSNDQEVFEIVGTYVSYSVADWTFACKSGDLQCASNNLPPQNFNLEFRTFFVQTNKPELTWTEQCRSEKYPGPSCLQEVFWIWPQDYMAEDFFYLYELNLGVLFGIFGFFIVYVMIMGFVCPC